MLLCIEVGLVCTALPLWFDEAGCLLNCEGKPSLSRWWFFLKKTNVVTMRIVFLVDSQCCAVDVDSSLFL